MHQQSTQISGPNAIENSIRRTGQKKATTANVDSILRDLAGVRSLGGNKWESRCSAHDDRHASLSITLNDKGRILLHCHAGCTTHAVLSAIGKRFADLFPDTESPSGKPTGKIVATYPYVDADGVLLFEKLRYEPKAFAQRRADGAMSMEGVKRVLYRLPEIAAADTVYIANGEKAADALTGLGLCATCDSRGEAKWIDDYNAALTGKHVVVPIDNDATGELHGQMIGKALSGEAASVRIVALPGLPPKGDAFDWIANGGTAEKLRAIVANTAVFDPNEATTLPAATDGAPQILVPGSHFTADRGFIDVGSHQFTNDVIDHLPDSTYRRGGLAGEVIGEPGTASFVPFGNESMRIMVDRKIRLVKQVRKGAGEQAELAVLFCPCTRDHAALLLSAAANDLRLPQIRMLTPYPIYRSGFGRAVKGFDRGIYFDEPAELAGLNPELDAEVIVGVFDDLLIDFPFKDEASR